MNAKSLIAVAALAAAASGFAQAGEADTTLPTSHFVSTRTRAEVQAEARFALPGGEAARSVEVGAPTTVRLDVKTVRAQAAQALRAGQIGHGEAAM